MDEATLGLGASYLNAPFDPWQEWMPANRKEDSRLHKPAEFQYENEAVLYGGGRRMTHPYLDPLVYPSPPDRTLNFGRYPLTGQTSVVVKTLDGAAVAHYPDLDEDLVIEEIWEGQLATEVDFFYGLHVYLQTPLLPGQFIGWRPTDLTPKVFLVDLLSVFGGNSPQSMRVVEMGTERPFMMPERLTIRFKLVREIEDPAGVVIGEGL
jgi:hypothetical protein